MISYRKTGDIGAAQEILRQKTPAMAMRYARAAVSEQVKKARRALDAGWATFPHRVSTPAGKIGSKRPPMAARGQSAEASSRGRRTG